jgi:thiamine biosynthesis lipoprotein
LIALAFACLVVAASGSIWGQRRPSGGHTVVREAFLMGTTLRAEVSAPIRAEAFAAVQQAFDTVAALEGVLSTWRDDSEIARINHAPIGETVAVSPTLAALLEEAARWAEATGGAFDPGVGALTDAWDLRGHGRVPDRTLLARARAATGISQFALTELGGPSARAARRSTRAWLDTGGFGKGAALRAAVAVLRHRGVEAGTLNFGGQVAVFGHGPANGVWLVPVAHPDHRLAPVAALRVRDGSVSTSAQSERFVEVGGRRFGHILDPRSGRPVEAWGSVTVVAADAAVADMLSTALFVLGPEAGPRWARAHDVAALFLVSRPGRELDVRPTPALRPLLVSPRTPSGG